MTEYTMAHGRLRIRRRFAVLVLVCVYPILTTACGGHTPAPPKEDPQMQQLRKMKKDG